MSRLLRISRGAVLGLMFMLAGSAPCWCDSYDPDPYDDIPPIVSVEFHCLPSSGVAVSRSQAQAAKQPHHLSTVSSAIVTVANPQALPQHGQVLPGEEETSRPRVVPLRT